MNLLSILLTGILVTASVCHAQQPDQLKIYPYSFPVKTLPCKHYLVDRSNQPFFWSGDAAWSLIAQLSSRDAEFYLQNRRDQGFSVIMVSLIEHKFCTNPPSNFYGARPFSGKAFISPDEKYFAHADSVIESAARQNMVVLLDPLYLGYGCGDEGWCKEVKEASLSDLHSWGVFLGKRYKKFGNIIWLAGGDTDPLPVKDKVLAMVNGIRENDTIHLFSAHNQPESMAVTPWKNERWLSVNNVYSYDSTVYISYRKAFDYKKDMPYFQIESAYENEHKSSPAELRSYAYWAILSGAMGHVFGNCPIWHFGSAKTWCHTNDWKNEMNNQGSASMDYLQRLFRSRSWQLLVPDFENKLVTSGYGKWGTKDHVASAISSDSTTIIAYLPSSRSITVELNKIKGTKTRCWWYNPSTGKATDAGTNHTSQAVRLTPETEGDWVLVIDNESVKLPVPGSEALLKAVKIRK